MADVNFARIRENWKKQEETDWSVTPERAKYLEENYPKDTPEEYSRLTPEEFFDGN